LPLDLLNLKKFKHDNPVQNKETNLHELIHTRKTESVPSIKRAQRSIKTTAIKTFKKKKICLGSKLKNRKKTESPKRKVYF